MINVFSSFVLFADEKLNKFPEKVNCSSGTGHRSMSLSSSLSSSSSSSLSSSLSVTSNHVNSLADSKTTVAGTTIINSCTTSPAAAAAAAMAATGAGSSHRHATRASLVGGGHSLQGVLRPQQTMKEILASVPGVSKKVRYCINKYTVFPMLKY